MLLAFTPSLQTWAPSSTDGCRVPRLPDRTCDAPSGWWPRTGAPPRHPVGREKRHKAVKREKDQDFLFFFSSGAGGEASPTGS